jgi:hypothetical protein
MSNPKQLTPHEKFIIDLKKFTAVTAVGVQALRRQGVGVIGSIQKYLDALDLSQTTSLKDQDEFIRWLDEVTDALVDKYEVSWGAARKAINLFLHACFYNRYLYVEYGLDRLETWLEIPLDQVIAGQLRKERRKKAGRGLLPPWSGLGGLDKKKSEQFQECASQMATDEKLSRVHLDVGLWVNNRK